MMRASTTLACVRASATAACIVICIVLPDSASSAAVLRRLPKLSRSFAAIFAMALCTGSSFSAFRILSDVGAVAGTPVLGRDPVEGDYAASEPVTGPTFDPLSILL